MLSHCLSLAVVVELSTQLADFEALFLAHKRFLTVTKNFEIGNFLFFNRYRKI